MNDTISDTISNIAPENDMGNIEYKLKLIELDDEKLNKRITQMKFRLNEGNGEALYYIGVMDNGSLVGLEDDEYYKSIESLKLIACAIDCNILLLNETKVNTKTVGCFHIRENDNTNYIDLKIGVIGNVDSSKSSTIGCLTRGIMDDGRGKARAHVFNYKHELDTGRTSSIGHQILGFDVNGNIVNSKHDRILPWTEIVKNSKKIVTFFDLAGHEKYLRTTIYGLSSMYPDYCLIMVGANMGVVGMTKEHIGLCVSLKIPFIIIVSKLDLAPPDILKNTMKDINKIIKYGALKVPYLIKNKTDVVNSTKNIKSNSIVPILQISNVNGDNLDLLKLMLNLLPIRYNFSEDNMKPVELLIDNNYSVTGHACIVAGVLKSGIVRVNDTLSIGPYRDGTYKAVKVRSIHCKYKDIKEAYAGLYICLSLKNITRNEIKKGMVIVPNNIKYQLAIKNFKAFIHVLHSPTTICVEYQPFLHINQVRQSVKIKEIMNINDDLSNKSDNDKSIEKALRTDDKAIVLLEFNTPQYIKKDDILLFREGRIKCSGYVTEIL